MMGNDEDLVPIELSFGTGESHVVGHVSRSSDPEVWKPRVAELLRQVADVIEQGDDSDE